MWLDYWHRQAIFLSSNFQTDSGAHPIYSMSISGGSPWGVSGQDVKQTSHFHLVPRLKLFYSNSPNTGWQSWVRSSSYVYLNNMLIIWTNTTVRSTAIVFFYIQQHVLAVQISHHQVDVRYIKINVKRKRPLFMVVWIITILCKKKNGIIRLKQIHNQVTEFLRYNLNGTAN